MPRPSRRRRRAVLAERPFPAFGLLLEFASAPPDVRLARILNWCSHEVKLGATDPDDRVTWSHLLRAVLPDTWRVVIPVEPLAEASLHALHGGIRKGVEALMRGEPWVLTPPTGARCDRTRAGLGIVWEGDEETAIPHGVAQLAAAHADRLRACKQCHKPFLRRKRQEFDLPACGVAWRAAKKPAAR